MSSDYFEDFVKLTYLCQGFLVTKSPGLGHLWFITAIFACYWTTPLLQRITSWREGKYNSVIIILIGLLSISILCKDIGGYAWYYAWFFNYSVGYLIARINYKYKVSYLLISLGIFIFILYNINWLDIIEGTNLNVAFHAFLAHIIFILFLFGSKLVITEEVIQPFKLIEKYSLYIYIVHYPFTRVPWSVVGYTDNIILNILILLTVIILLMILLRLISKYTGILIDKILSKQMIKNT